MKEGEIKCNFCGKAGHKVWLMVQGCTATICQECVFLAMEAILERTRGEEPVYITITEKGKEVCREAAGIQEKT